MNLALVLTLIYWLQYGIMIEAAAIFSWNKLLKTIADLRQLPNEPEGGLELSTPIFNISEISSEEERYGKTLLAYRGPEGEGKLESYFYDPTAGYEPYWINGHWYIHPTNTTQSKTLGGGLCVYDECPESYILYGPVCGANRFMENKNFDTYCDMIQEDCSGGKIWSMVYRGKCLEGFDYFIKSTRYEFKDAVKKVINFFGQGNVDVHGVLNNIYRATKILNDYYTSSLKTMTYTHFTTTTTIEGATEATTEFNLGRR